MDGDGFLVAVCGITVKEMGRYSFAEYVKEVEVEVRVSRHTTASRDGFSSPRMCLPVFGTPLRIFFFFFFEERFFIY